MKLLSEATEYGLRAIVWLADRDGKPYKVQEIAKATKSPPGYLVKVLQLLARAGLVSSRRGIHGGFVLEKRPEDIRVLDVINAVDRLERITTCPLNLEAHGRNLCPLHRNIDQAVAYIEQTFASHTIADLLNEPGSSRPLCDVSIAATDFPKS